VVESRVLKRIFRPKRDEVTGEWRKLHNYELRDLYSSPSIIRIIKSRQMRWAGHLARMEKEKNAYRLLVGKPKLKIPLGRPRRKWVDNIRMDLGEVGWGYVDWIGLAQNRNRWRALVDSVLNLRVP
jgi:transcription termination factor 2